MSFHRTLDNVRSQCEEILFSLKKNVIDEFDQITKNFFQQKGMVCRYKEEYYYQILKQEWETKIIHFEWIIFNQDCLFDSKKMTFVIHIEGDREFQKTITDIIISSHKEETVFIPNYPVCYQKTYFIPNGKNSFAELSRNEKEYFLEGAYNDFMKFIDVIDNALKQSLKTDC